MAQADWGGHQAAHAAYPQDYRQEGSGLARAVNLTGAVLSLALIAGLGLWAYKLAMRDVTGVPVVRALEGPMRVQPENPGGVAAAHQGLAVNNIAAAGQAEGPADAVTLAPAPVGLAEGDAPARAGAEVSATLMSEAGEPVVAPVQPTDAVAGADPASLTEEPGDPVADALAIADAIAAAGAPLSGGETDLSLTPEAEAVMALADLPSVSPLDVIPADVPGVRVSPRPRARPADLATRADTSPLALALTSASAATMPGVRDVPADTIPAGTRLVQLGAFDSEDVARAEWLTISGRFEELFEAKDRVIERAQSGGKTFYRLRAMGFADLSDARRFCSALMAGQAACIPVVTR